MSRKALSVVRFLFGMVVMCLGIYGVISGKPGYEAIVQTAPVFRDYYMYCIGTIAIVAGVVYWQMLDNLDNIRRIKELEARIEELEREWSEADLGDEEDEIGYA